MCGDFVASDCAGVAILLQVTGATEMDLTGAAVLSLATGVAEMDLTGAASDCAVVADFRWRAVSSPATFAVHWRAVLSLSSFPTEMDATGASSLATELLVLATTRCIFLVTLVAVPNLLVAAIDSCGGGPVVASEGELVATLFPVLDACGYTAGASVHKWRSTLGCRRHGDARIMMLHVVGGSRTWAEHADAILYNIHHQMKRGKKDSHQKMTITQERNRVHDMNSIKEIESDLNALIPSMFLRV